MTVLVTGATGHVGSNLVRELLGRGESVRALVRDGKRSLEGLDVECVTGHVHDALGLDKAMRGVTEVFHLAAVISILGERGGEVARVNVEGVRTVARAARKAGVRRMIHMSSCHAFDLDATSIDEASARPKPSDPFYNRSKALGEAALREEIAQGLDAVIVNPTGVIGPFDFGPSRMGRFFLALAGGRLPGLVDGGFDFVDVRDLVASTIAAANKGRTGENYLLGGRYVHVSDVAAEAARITGVKAPRIVTPMWLARAGAPLMDVFGRTTGREPLYTSESLHALRAGRIDSRRAATELGHTPRPLADTVRDIYAWFEQTGALRRR
jgi:dihydroflavonol-4-reductase